MSIETDCTRACPPSSAQDYDACLVLLPEEGTALRGARRARTMVAPAAAQKSNAVAHDGTAAASTVTDVPTAGPAGNASSMRRLAIIEEGAPAAAAAAAGTSSDAALGEGDRGGAKTTVLDVSDDTQGSTADKHCSTVPPADADAAACGGTPKHAPLLPPSQQQRSCMEEADKLRLAGNQAYKKCAGAVG